MKVVKGSKVSWLVTAALCVGLFATAVAGNAWYVQSVNGEIQQRAASASEYSDEVEAQIAVIAERKAAEEKARQIAANMAADKAAAGDTSIDSKTCAASTQHIDPTSIDVIVNKKHCMQPLSYEPADLTTVHGATLSAQAVDSFRSLYEAAASDGLPFAVTSSYRSYETQINTYAYWVSVSGVDGADTYSARPGYSEHQTGFVIDVEAGGCALDCFGTTPQYQWFQDHAAEYGFIQRYYKGSESITGYGAEEWHYRYVGKDVALDMKSRSVKTLEEYWNIPGGDYYYDSTDE